MGGYHYFTDFRRLAILLDMFSNIFRIPFLAFSDARTVVMHKKNLFSSTRLGQLANMMLGHPFLPC